MKGRPTLRFRSRFTALCLGFVRGLARLWPIVIVTVAAALWLVFGNPRVDAGPGTPQPQIDSANANRADPFGMYQADHVEGEVLISFRPGTASGKRGEARGTVGASSIKNFPEIGVEHWRLPPGLSVESAVAVLSRNPNVQYAEPNYVVSADDLPANPNDINRGELWALHNLGQSGGTPDKDIDAVEAWALTTGSANVVIGVIDSGVDYTHPDLAANIWTNTAEAAGATGVDDDGNGYVDDVHGWDFANNDNDPMDDNGHGTHVSGTIGAVGNNGIGVAGVNWNVRLMPLKFLGANGSGDVAAAISAVLYASRFKAGGVNVVRITNNSWGGGKKSAAMQDAINNSGSLFVAAAGNGGSNQLAYPAGYNSANVLSVAATDHNDNLATFSNYSSSWVDLAAPGVNIASTYKDHGYGLMSGTSMASPHVAGVAGLVLAANPGLAVTGVKSAIMNSVDIVPALAGKTLTGGRLNAARAVGSSHALSDNCLAEPCAPGNVSDLASDPSVTPTSITLSWTATGDDGSLGSAYLVDIRFSNSPINAGNFAQATIASGKPAPQATGVYESFEVKGLRPSTTYYFAMRVADEVGNYSGLAYTSGTTAVAPWTTTVIENGANDVGFYKSLAYDNAGNPSIGYSDETAEDIKFTRWNGTSWVTEIVDGTAKTGIDLDYDRSSGNPALTYGWGPLRYAQKVGSSWQITIVESKNAYNDVTSLAFAPNGSPGISYRVSTASGRGSLKFAKKTSTGWSLQTVAAAAARYSSLAYDAAGNPSIAFSDDPDGDGTLSALRFARWNGSGWTVETLESGVAGYGVMASLAYDDAGNPAILHTASGVIRFVRWNGNSWVSQVVANGYNGSLMYAGGSFYASYNQSDDTVFVAKRMADNTWSAEPVAFGERIRWLMPMAMPTCGSPSLVYSTSPNADLRFLSSCQ